MTLPFTFRLAPTFPTSQSYSTCTVLNGNLKRDPNPLLHERHRASRSDSHALQHPLRNVGSVEIPFPQDFSAIAGNTSAIPQNDIDEKYTTVCWWCEDNVGEEKYGENLPIKTCGTHLQTTLHLLDCIETANLLSNAYSSRSYENDGYYPTGLKRISQLRISMRYHCRKIIHDG